MAAMKKLVFAGAMLVSLALTSVLVLATFSHHQEDKISVPAKLIKSDAAYTNAPNFYSKRLSRFLAESEKNPRPAAASHCNKDNSICSSLQRMYNNNATTCCNNKCIDVQTDSQNCGACKNKCRYPEVCCGGQCMDLANDEGNCGECNNKCMTGKNCITGMCGYA